MIDIDFKCRHCNHIFYGNLEDEGDIKCPECGCEDVDWINIDFTNFKCGCGAGRKR
ncbi:MAG: hypothetical protein ACYCX4_06375 [Bacillota bacterium]